MMLNAFTERRCPLVPSESVGGVLLLLAGVLGALFAPAAGADVTLSTRVEKVESILDGSGNVQRRLIPADGVQPGEELRYTITVSNDSALLVSEGRVVVTNPVPEGTVYLPGTAGGADCLIEFSNDGEIFSAPGVAAGSDTAEGSLPAEGSLSAEGSLPAEADEPTPVGAPGGALAVRDIRWTLQRDLEPGASHDLFFHVRMEAGGGN